jgi:hypothetical protein
VSFDLDQATAVLSRTPATLRAMLDDLPSEWVTANEGANTWSAFDVVGHLIHGERTDWIPRARIILDEGERRAFEPFNRFAQCEASRGHALGELLATFAELRRDNLATLASWRLSDSDLAKTGIHPELGRVTLAQLLATWVAHDLDHVVQISRTMATQYRDAVGPWRAYISVVR